MKEIISWERCLKTQIISEPRDLKKATALLKMSEFRIKTITETKEKSFILLEQYYEAIKELLISLMTIKGIKSLNRECLISYFNKQL